MPLTRPNNASRVICVTTEKSKQVTINISIPILIGIDNTEVHVICVAVQNAANRAKHEVEKMEKLAKD